MLIILSILFPVLAGIILYIRNVHKEQEGHGLYTAALLITDALAVLAVLFSGPVTLFRLSDMVTISFSFDRIGVWFLAAVLILYTCVLFYSFVYMRIEERDSSFFAFYFISLGALIAVCSSANLVTIYFAFEITTLSTVPLVLHEQTKAAVAAGLKYLFYSIGGALLGLLGSVVFIHRQVCGRGARRALAQPQLEPARLSPPRPLPPRGWSPWLARQVVCPRSLKLGQETLG